MSDTIQQREMLKQVYDSKKWAAKVDKMSDSQVFAIFMRLRQQNKL